MKLKVTREKFEELYNKYSNQQLSQLLRVSTYYIEQAAEELGLEKKRKGRALKHE